MEKSLNKYKAAVGAGADPYTHPSGQEALEDADNFYNKSFCMAVKDKWLKQ